jgi:ELWxxDGT repeat protein
MHRNLLTLPILLSLLTGAAPGFVLPVAAQTALLVKDISRGRGETGAYPGEMWPFRDKVLFTAEEPSSGREMWVTDGTAAGTRLLADLFPGEDSSQPDILGATGSLVFGVAVQRSSCCGTWPSFLWRSDGTREGTFLLDPGLEISIPYKDRSDDFREGPIVPVALMKEAVYFTGCKGQADCGLWRTDGTVAGTRLLKAIGGDFLGGYPSELTVAGDRLFFVAGLQLWISDGTPEGTTPVADLGVPRPHLLVALGRQVLFLAQAAAPGTGEELWASDGTAAGTRALTSFEVAQPFKQTYFLKVLGDKVYFVADDATHGAELWASNGTPGGTVQVTSFGFHDPFDNEDNSGLLPQALEKVGDRLVFPATDGLTGVQLWSTRGTPQSTAPVCPNCTFFSEVIRFVKLDGKLLFSAEELNYGRELFTTDGTAAGTKRLKDACPGYCDGVASDLVLQSGTVFFQGPNVESFEDALWMTDGTAQGTRRVATPRLRHGTDQPPVALLGRKVVFNAFAAGQDVDDRQELWVSDGTPAGTRQLTANGTGSSADIEDLLAVGDRVFFTAFRQDGYSRSLWRSGGTAEDTLELPDLSLGGDSRLFTTDGKVFLVWEDYPQGDQIWRVLDDGRFQQLTGFGSYRTVQSPVPYKGRLYFLLDGKELWATDGTVAGTGRAVEVSGVEELAFLEPVGSELWFLAESTSSYGLSQVWRTDGTQAGTRLVHDFGVYRTHRDPEFTKIGSTVYFVALRPENGDFNYQVWKSSGTGATMFTDFPSVSSLEAQPAELTSFQGQLYFMANLPGVPARRGLWRSDGTAAGTVLVQDFPFPAYDFFRETPHQGLTVIGSRLVFTADDGIHGDEPWASDGTSAGTVLLRDVFPGVAGSEPSGYTEAAGRLYFSAYDGAHGNELWRTDGTPQGTRLVQDIAPEGASSDPAGFTVAGNRLFFSADDGLTGNELWVLPLSGPACQPSATALCLNGGRFKVEAFWVAPSSGEGPGRAVPLAADTGAFWFFDSANIEVILKVLDGRGVNGHFWAFYGALSDVEYALTVTDTETGLARRYVNPPGQLASVGDTQAFGPLGARAARRPASLGARPVVTERIDAAAATGTCVPSPARLCLNGGRFAVEASWKDFTNRTGSGTAVALTADTGYFWFFDASNVETALKVLDGTSLNGHFWVFYGALSNVEYTLTVTDTVTGKVKTYRNPKGQFASVADTSAF